MSGLNSATNQYNVSEASTHLLTVASANGACHPVTLPIIAPTIFCHEHSREKRIGSIAEEGLENTVLVTFNIHFDGVNSLKPLVRRNIQQGAQLNIDRSPVGNPRFAEIANSLKQPRAAGTITNGIG